MDHIIPANAPTLLCRLCLCEDVYMFPIFNETNIYLPQRIAACVNVEVYKTDRISTLICKQCLNKINDWHEFKKNCDDSQSKLRYWNNSLSNEPMFFLGNHIKEEIFNYSDEETITPEYVEVVKSGPLDICYDEVSNNDVLFSNEENDPVSTTMYFPLDENPEINPEPETLLVPSHEVSLDAHGLDVPIKQQLTNGIEDIKIKQVYRVLPCRICGKNFNSLPNRSQHERVEHMINFKAIKCFTCNQTWGHEDELLNHFILNHSVNNISIGYTSNTFDKSHEYLKELTENLVLLRNQYSSAKQISLKSFMYYNQFIQKMVDRNSIDSNTSLKKILDHLFNQNLIINNTCHQCCISFKSLTEFKQHISKRYCKKRMRLVESGQIQINQHFKCSKCDRIFGCKMLLMHHIRVDHTLCGDVPEKCDVCMKPFQSKHDYNSHIQETCSYQIYCSICELLFNTTDDFKLHSKVHDEPDLIDETQKIFNKKLRKFWKNKCSLCTKFYRFYGDLVRHFKKNHTQFKLITCKYCGDNFISELERGTHIKNVHYKNNTDLEQHEIKYNNTREYLDSPLFTCNICEQIFNFEEEIKKHIQTNHIDTKITNILPGQIYTCSICQRSFNSNRALLIHDFRMHRNKKKKISCLKCHKTFFSVKTINAHVEQNHCIPTKVKTTIKKEKTNPSNNLTCIVCKKKFFTKKSLHCHARIHYQYNKSNAPNCQVCGYRCKNTQELLNHFKSHSSKSLAIKYNINTKIPRKTTVPKAYKCNICMKVYTSKGSLSKHNTSKHKNQKKLLLKNQIIKTRPSCMVCKERLGLNTDLVDHMLAHVAKDDEFKCKRCNKSFVYSEYLSHMSTTHQTYDCILCNKKLASYASLCTHKGWHYR